MVGVAGTHLHVCVLLAFLFESFIKIYFSNSETTSTNFQTVGTPSQKSRPFTLTIIINKIDQQKY